MAIHLRSLATVALPLFLVAACGTPWAPASTPNLATEYAVDLTTLPAEVPGGTIDRSNTITSAALASNLVGDPPTRGFSVYLPPGYDKSDKHYPVVYVLQGLGGGVNFLGLAGYFDSLIAAGKAQEMILVFFNGVNKLGGSWYLSSPTIGDYETFIADELVSYVDATYRTLPTRESRGIAGCAMGGYGALHLALIRPDAFSVAAPMSAPYDWEHWTASILLEEDRPDVLISLAAAAAPNPDSPPLYLDVPYKVVNGEPELEPDVMRRINAHDPVVELELYLGQPTRLRGLMIYQDDDLDPDDPFTQAASAFDKTLTERGVDHEFIQVEAAHCGGDCAPILEFMSSHLAQ